MSSSNGRSDIAFGGLLVLGFVLPLVFLQLAHTTAVLPDPDGKGCQPSDQRDDTESDGVGRSDSQNQNPADPKKRTGRKSDYCIQWRTAVATERQADYSQIGFWLFVFTFMATVAAAVAAVVAAIAARRTVRTMQDTAERQLRAYVFLDMINLVDASQLPLLPADSVTQGDLFGRTPDLAEDAPQNRPRGYPGVDWSIKNSGQTPAYDVVHWSDFDVIETANEHTVVVPPIDSRAPKTYIAPSGTNTKHKWFNRPLTEAEMSEIRAGTRAIYVFGRVEYKDAFGKKRSTSYRLRYTLAAYPPVGPTTFTYCEHGNSADEEQQ